MTANISNNVWPGQTHFGFGAAGIAGSEAKALGAESVFILTDPSIITAQLLNPVTRSVETEYLSFVINDKMQSDPDIASLEAAPQAFRESGAKVIQAIGGGSVLDAARDVRMPAGQSIPSLSTCLIL